MPLRINSLEDVPGWSEKAKAALVDQGIPDVRSGGTRRGSASSDYVPLSFSDLRREEARTLIAAYRLIRDILDVEDIERARKLAEDALELVEQRLADLGKA